MALVNFLAFGQIFADASANLGGDPEFNVVTAFIGAVSTILAVLPVLAILDVLRRHE
jgi:hypothetical protein